MARRLVGIRVERQLVTVPVAGPVGCVEFAEGDCCAGSGSGSGSGGGECIFDCDACSGGMSAAWTVAVDGYDTFTVYHDEGGADGTNYCTFNSTDLVWQLQYDYADEIWLLVNFDTGAVWFLAAAGWATRRRERKSPRPACR